MADRKQWQPLRESVYENALEHYGKENQLVIALEELSEAQKEICKFLRGNGNRDHLAEEVADAFIVLEQVERIYGICDEVTSYMTNKVARLSDRIRAEKWREVTE